MDIALKLLGAAGLWLLWEFAGSLLVELLRPVFDGISRSLARPVNRRTVTLLWLVAGLSLVFWPFALKSGSDEVRIASLIAFLSLTTVALMAMFTLREQTRPEVPSTRLPLARFVAGTLAILSAVGASVIVIGDLRSVWHSVVLLCIVYVLFGGVALWGRVPGAALMLALRDRYIGPRLK